MQLTTVLLLTSSLTTMVMGATDIMECHKPALLSNCKKVCDCPGDAWNGNVRPDCSLPICHDNCLCHADPPPRYKSPTPPPPYAGKGKVKGHRRAPEPEPEPEPEAYEDGFEY